MQAWIGPAIVAALVSGIVSMLGWVVTFRATLRLEPMRRAEKVHDMQVAVRAEIQSDLINLKVVDRARFLAEIKDRYEREAGYSVVVPHMARNVVFDALIAEIHVLPGQVIAPVIHYGRLRQTIERFVDDLRAPGFAQLAAARQLMMYSDYLNMLGRLEALAEDALRALDQSLLNSPDADRWNPGSASASGGEPAAGSASSWIHTPYPGSLYNCTVRMVQRAGAQSQGAR